MGWGRRTTHLAFGEVAGTEGSFYPLAVSREHLEKTESRESESCSVVSDSLRPHGLYSPWNSPPLVPRFGEGNGTPLQYSCLENPMDGGAW